MTRKKRKTKGGRKKARSRSTRPQQAQSRRSGQARQKGPKKWLYVLPLVAILISVGGGFFLTRQGNTGPTVTGTTIASSANVRRITVQELKAKLDAGQAVVVDARRQSSYIQRHIAGAISLPQSEVAARLAELPTDKLAVFYCA